jgi:hypothetical protein
MGVIWTFLIGVIEGISASIAGFKYVRAFRCWLWRPLRRIRELRALNDTLVSENAALVERNTALVQENATLKKEKSALCQQVAELTKKLQTFEIYEHYRTAAGELVLRENIVRHPHASPVYFCVKRAKEGKLTRLHPYHHWDGREGLCCSIHNTVKDW